VSAPRHRPLRAYGSIVTNPAAAIRPVPRSLTGAFVAGAAVGLLGGMIGLGGAEFRLPLLIGVFGFVALQAVVLNKAMSLLVVLSAMAAGSVAGTVIGGLLLGVVPSPILIPVLVALLLVSAVKVWRHP
jgi:uncharacterized protein